VPFEKRERGYPSAGDQNAGDAYSGNFDTCYLFRSDIDYLPVIEAVRRMGRHVIVVGFGEGIARDSPFLYVPERFVDIGEEFMRARLRLKS
jgi:uncharacterized LabA/DUF88 family protein